MRWLDGITDSMDMGLSPSPAWSLPYSAGQIKPWILSSAAPDPLGELV